jgi:hypothetical protein
VAAYAPSVGPPGVGEMRKSDGVSLAPPVCEAKVLPELLCKKEGDMSNNYQPRKSWLPVLITVLAIALALACGGTVSLTPELTNTPPLADTLGPGNTPGLTNIPRPTDTPIPTDTPLPPTNTSSPTLTNTPTPTSTVAPVGMNEPVEGAEWRVIVRSATSEGDEITTSFRTQTFHVSNSDEHFFRIEVELERLNGEQIGADYLFEEDSVVPGDPLKGDARQIVVIDSTGSPYRFVLAGPAGFYYDVTAEEVQQIMFYFVSKATIDYVFVVPDDAAIVEFVWSGLPPVRLIR